jgi:hypothetical protein
MAKGRLRLSIEDFLETFGFGDRIKQWLDEVIEKPEQEGSAMTSGIRGLINSQLESNPELKAEINNLLGANKPIGITAVIGLILGCVLVLGQGMFSPYAVKLKYWVDRSAKSFRPSPEVIATMINRMPNKEKILEEAYHELGLTDTLIKGYKALTTNYLDEGGLITLFRRGIIDKPTLIDELHLKGWDNLNANWLLLATEARPSVQDLIHMAVREAFSPDAISRFGLLTALPSVYVEEAKKLGLSAEWANRYWAAHWVLPGLQTGFEMLHRLRPGVSSNPFTMTDMRALIKALDIAPAFHDRLIEISYQPYTRVDVRRLYQDGVITVDEVYQNYLDLGYNEHHASKLTEWTIKDKSADKKAITQAAFMKSFKLGQSTRSETISNLSSIGYDESDANFYVSLAEYELEQDRQEDLIDAVRIKYVEGHINKNDAVSELSSLGIPPTQTSSLIAEFDVQRLKKITLPSRADLDSFYLDDIIDENEYMEGLRSKRYTEDRIQWYLQRLDRKKAKEAIKTAESAAKEQERLRTAEVKSQYREDKAKIDTQIAELRLAIAELQAVKHEIEEVEVLDKIASRIANLKAMIAELNVTKANLKYDIETEL